MNSSLILAGVGYVLILGMVVLLAWADRRLTSRES